LACGEILTLPRRPVTWEHQPIIRPHRGGTLLKLAIIALLSSGFVLAPIVVIWRDFRYAAVPLFWGGMLLGPIVAIVATLDLAAMREEQMDAAGKGNTRIAQVIALVTTVGAVFQMCLVLSWLLSSRH
jgi:Sec-independent protein secretion pathway component TatC